MLSSLVTTKLHIPPLRSDHVRRPRLVDALENGYRSGKRLSLISAPAGYGKTSLLSEWQEHLTDQQVPMAWLSLEDNDNEAQRFLHYEPGWRKRPVIWMQPNIISNRRWNGYR